MRRLFYIFVFLLIACPAWGATKTVCASGCDYTTIAAASSGATAGDTVNVSTGTYNENNPTFTKALTWVAIDGNGTVTITNSGTGAYAATFTGNNAAILITGFIFDGLNVKASAISLAANAQNKTCDHCIFQNATNLITFNGGGITNISNSSFLGSPEYVLYGNVGNLTANNNTFNVTVGTAFGYITGGIITFIGSSSTVAFSTAAAFWDLNGSNITLNSTGNIINVSGGGNKYINGTRSSSSGSVTISDTITSSATYSSNVFYFNVAGWAIDFNHTNITITNADYTGTLFAFINQINPKIRNSTITMTAPTSTNAFTPIAISSLGTDGTNGGTVTGATLTNNTIYSINKTGYIISIGSETSNAGNNKLDNAILSHNKIYGYDYFYPEAGDASTHGIFVGHNTAYVMFNDIYGGPYGIVLKGSGAVWASGGAFYNKVIGSKNHASLLFKGVKNVPAFNNTLEALNSVYLIAINENNSGQEATGITLKNNVVVSSNPNVLLIDADALTGFSSDNNLFYRVGGDAINFTVGGVDKTFSQWQALGYDANGLNSDPLFISATNFHLQSSSPARGTGVNVGLVHLDSPDIGAEPYLQYVPWRH
ncbi:MAG: hypothetical protein WCY05_07210 [Candidatus Omnitrophota bacterium]